MDYRAAMRPRSGIGRYVAALAAELPHLGVDLRLFGVFRRGNRPGVRVAPPGSRLVGWPVPTRAVDLLGRVGLLPADRILGGCDLYHHTDFQLAEVSARTPQVMTLHDLAFLRHPEFYPEATARALALVVREAARRCAAFLVPSEATACDVEELLGIKRRRIYLAPLGVDRGFGGGAPGPPRNRRYLLAIGTLEPRKNHQRVIRALPGGVDLLVAGGRGWLDEETLALAAARPEVKLLGRVGEEELRHLVAGADGVVYPSLFEGFGLPVLEAMAAGRPVLTSDREPMRSIAGGAALLVDPEDEGALREGMGRLLDDEGLRSELMSRGPERAREFTWRACAEASLRAYEAVAG